VIKAHGDLHDFMHWQGPILTDSGGFQVFSLGDMRKISEAGVDFRSPKDGAKIFMGPEESIKIQFDLGADIVMIFDECTPYPADKATADQSMQLSLHFYHFFLRLTHTQATNSKSIKINIDEC
jgi:queuine tRNA-ribosyltransferase